MTLATVLSMLWREHFLLYAHHLLTLSEFITSATTSHPKSGARRALDHQLVAKEMNSNGTYKTSMAMSKKAACRGCSLLANTGIQA